METITPLEPSGVDLELVSLRDRGLVDVAAQDQFRTGVDERGQDMRCAARPASFATARARRSSGDAS